MEMPRADQVVVDGSDIPRSINPEFASPFARALCAFSSNAIVSSRICLGWQDLDRDNFMSAQQAKDYGLVDTVIKLTKKPTKTT